MNKNRNVLLAVLGVVLIIGVIVALRANDSSGEISSFTECVQAGNPVMESHPRQCQTEDGRVFVEDVEDPNATTSTQSVTVAGAVEEVDTSQISVDGPYIISVETNDGTTEILEVPSMGSQLCAARTTIGSAFELEAGQEVSVRGARNSDGAIVPCDSVDHYVQVSGENAAILSVGETATINGLSVTLEEIVQESRCPVDAECIESGATTLRVTLENSETTTTNIASDEVPYTFGGYEIAITDIKPPLLSDREIDQTDYSIVFEVAEQ